MQTYIDILDDLNSQRHGKKVVLVSGGFDLFHIGHLNYIEKASQQGDILVVHIDSDISIKHRKGVGRPIIGERVRAKIISALKFVDYVFVGEDDVDNFFRSKSLKAINPDTVILALKDSTTDSKVKEQDKYITNVLPEVKIVYIKEFENTHTSSLIKDICAPFRNADLADPDTTLLINAAKAIQPKGRSFSGLRIGAAVMADNNKIYAGCNISSSSPALTICAERMAISMAVADGAGAIQKIAVYSPTDEVTYPCGYCRQSIYDLSSPELPAIVYASNDISAFVSDINQLLPAAFSSPRKFTYGAKISIDSI